MSLFDIKTFPDTVLKQKCSALEDVTKEDADILNNMVFTMYHYKGIGLAAPQVGILKRLIAVDIGDGPIKIVNPKIVDKKGADIMPEGCLSLPGVEVEVERPSEIVVLGLNELNEKIEIKASGLLAKAIQHEVDHLDGKMIIDYLNIIERTKAVLNIEGKA